jgi:hypothetical protein
MKPPTQPRERLLELVRRIEAFEAGASIANTGTGARREGEGFEKLLREFWVAVRDEALASGAAPAGTIASRRRHWCRLACDGRALCLPDSGTSGEVPATPSQELWLRVVFPVSELIASYPGTEEAIRRYSPDSGPFAGPK